MRGILYNEFWDWVVYAACVIGGLAALTFVVKFQIESRGAWRDNPFGRFLMTRKILLFVLFTTVMTYRLYGDWPGRRILVALMMVAFAFQTFVPYRLLMRAQAEAAERRRMHSLDHPGAAERE